MRKIGIDRVSLMILQLDTDDLYMKIDGEFIKWNGDFQYDASKKIEWYLKTGEEIEK